MDRGVDLKVLLAAKDFWRVAFLPVAIDISPPIEQRASHPYLGLKTLTEFHVSHTKRGREHRAGELLRRREQVRVGGGERESEVGTTALL